MQQCPYCGKFKFIPGSTIYSKARTIIRTKHPIDILKWASRHLDEYEFRCIEDGLSEGGKAEAIRHINFWERARINIEPLKPKLEVVK